MFKKLLIPFFIVIIFLAGCQSSSEEEFVFPEGKFTITPETVKVNEPITFELKITAGEKEVDDADVSFEYWIEEKTDEEHTTEPAKNQGNGIYSLEASFAEPGTYFVYYHADALDMHLMEKYQFTVNE